MRAGALIEYRLRLHGLPVAWLTRIEEWDDDPTHPRFVDMQLTGPYRLWHHTHEFHELPDGGTLMTDTVRYALPLGPLGSLAHRLLVRRDLERIFDFRARTVPALVTRR
jgi:ligand-binding SRPBCC domain-containing protein